VLSPEECGVTVDEVLDVAGVDAIDVLWVLESAACVYLLMVAVMGGEFCSMDGSLKDVKMSE
jgi:hypothetical protein